MESGGRSCGPVRGKSKGLWTDPSLLGLGEVLGRTGWDGLRGRFNGSLEVELNFMF